MCIFCWKEHRKGKCICSDQLVEIHSKTKCNSIVCVNLTAYTFNILGPRFDSRFVDAASFMRVLETFFNTLLINCMALPAIGHRQLNHSKHLCLSMVYKLWTIAYDKASLNKAVNRIYADGFRETKTAEYMKWWLKSVLFLWFITLNLS